MDLPIIILSKENVQKVISGGGNIESKVEKEYQELLNKGSNVKEFSLKGSEFSSLNEMIKLEKGDNIEMTVKTIFGSKYDEERDYFVYKNIHYTSIPLDTKQGTNDIGNVIYGWGYVVKIDIKLKEVEANLSFPGLLNASAKHEDINIQVGTDIRGLTGIDEFKMPEKQLNKIKNGTPLEIAARALVATEVADDTLTDLKSESIKPQILGLANNENTRKMIKTLLN